jgi:hypothetical protein
MGDAEIPRVHQRAMPDPAALAAALQTGDRHRAAAALRAALRPLSLRPVCPARPTVVFAVGEQGESP